MSLPRCFLVDRALMGLWGGGGGLRTLADFGLGGWRRRNKWGVPEHDSMVCRCCSGRGLGLRGQRVGEKGGMRG